MNKSAIIFALPILILCGTGRVASASTPVKGEQLFNLADVPAKERTAIATDHWPELPGQASVCMWKDDKLAAISFTIDDNCAMNVDWWLQTAEAYEVPLTWFLVTMGIDKNDGRGAMNGTWELWRRAQAAGHAIESHTVSHLSASKNLETWPGIEWEYRGSQEQINAGIPDSRALFLAYPGGGQSKLNNASVAAKFYLAARGTKGVCNGPRNIDYLNVAAMSKVSIAEGQPDAWGNLNNLIDKTLYRGSQYGGWAVTLDHYVKEPFGPYLEKFEFYKRHRDKLWAGTFGDVARYGQQRDTSTLEVLESTPARIALRLTDRMDDSFYDVPLTVKVRLPDAWTGTDARQNGESLDVCVVGRDGARFALVPVVPDRGDVVLAPAS